MEYSDYTNANSTNDWKAFSPKIALKDGWPQLTRISVLCRLHNKCRTPLESVQLKSTFLRSFSLFCHHHHHCRQASPSSLFPSLHPHALSLSLSLGFHFLPKVPVSASLGCRNLEPRHHRRYDDLREGQHAPSSPSLQPSGSPPQEEVGGTIGNRRRGDRAAVHVGAFGRLLEAHSSGDQWRWD